MENSARTIRPSRFEWIDAYEGEGEWYGTDYEATDRIMVTYGYPISINKSYIAVASTYDKEMEQYACVVNIPIGMIVSIKEVSEETYGVTPASADTETQRQCTLRHAQLQG